MPHLLPAVFAFAFGIAAPRPATAQAADDIAAPEVGLLFARGDYAAMPPKLEGLVARGHPRAQAILGYRYEKGLGTKRAPVCSGARVADRD
jgi:TPR repeat protein